MKKGIIQKMKNIMKKGIIQKMKNIMKKGIIQKMEEFMIIVMIVAKNVLWDVKIFKIQNLYL